MAFYADLHIHSKYSRATSKNCDLEHLAIWARKKGISIVGTGDFTHPAWIAELKDKLVPAEPGLFRLRFESETFDACVMDVLVAEDLDLGWIGDPKDQGITVRVFDEIGVPIEGAKISSQLGALDRRNSSGFGSRHLRCPVRGITDSNGQSRTGLGR